MIGTLLFQGNMPESMEILKTDVEGVCSIYAPRAVGKAKISPTIARIVKAMHDGKIAVGTKADKTIIEMPAKSGIDIVVKDAHGSLCATTYDNDTESCSDYIVGHGKRFGTALVASLITDVLKDTESNNAYQDCIKALNDSNAEDLEKALALLSNNVYYRLVSGAIEFDIPSTKRINPIKNFSIVSGVYTPDTVIYGGFKILKGKEVKERKADLSTTYENPYLYTEEENSLIPNLPDGYTYAPQTVKGINYILKTSGRLAFRNCLFAGPPGTGKTAAAMGIAAYLKCPYYVFTCDAHTSGADFSGYVIPSSNENNGITLSGEDIMYDPEGSYKKITGKDMPEGFSEAEVFDLYLKTKANEKEGLSYNVVMSPICKAQLTDGWVVVEIQEPANIVQAGAMTALNSILEPDGYITAPDGKILKRNPQCIFVLTMNDETKASRGIDEAILSRMQYVPDFGSLTEEDLVERAMKITGCADEELAQKLTKAVVNVRSYIKDNELNGSICDARELYNWMVASIVSGDPVEAFEETILGKISDKDEREIIKTTYIDAVFVD